MQGKEISELVQERCVTACCEFLREQLPDLAVEHPARYVSYLIEGNLRDRGGDDLKVDEDGTIPQCVRLSSPDGDASLIAIGINLSRERTEQTLEMLRGSKAKERVLLYLFSFESRADEDLISQAMMEPELLQMVRDTGIVAYFAMLDARAGMGMMARIDGDMRSIQYLPH